MCAPQQRRFLIVRRLLSLGSTSPGPDRTSVKYGTKGVFDLLDALRGLAALVVVWAHLGAWTAPYRPVLAGVSVDLFFAISGFVIAHSYEDRLANGWTVGKFLLVRLVRLYPMYMAGIAVSVALWFVLPIGHDSKAALVQASMLPYPTSTSLYPLNGPAWSIFFELIINLAYAVSYRAWKIPNILGLMASSAVGLLLCALAGQTVDGGWDWKEFPVGVARVSYGFASGVLVFRLYSAGQRLPTLPRIITVCMAILPTILAPRLPELLWRLPIILIVIPLALSCAVSASTRSPKVCALYLGRLSYPLYALHYPCLYGATIAFSRFVSNSPLEFAAIFIVFIVMTSFLIESTCDRPVRGWLSRRLI
jgi:peptidoglycan/LPS O-acetylase OafA/YrhL